LGGVSRLVSVPVVSSSAHRRSLLHAGSGRVQDLPATVGTARRAGSVRQLLAVALRALDQRHRGRLPLRETRPGVAARHFSLGNSHVGSPVSLLLSGVVNIYLGEQTPPGVYLVAVPVLRPSAREPRTAFGAQ